MNFEAAGREEPEAFKIRERHLVCFRTSIPGKTFSSQSIFAAN